MFLPAKIYFLIFGILTIAGGLIGYLKAGSIASIIAGLISGALLIVAAFLFPLHATAGLTIALVVSLLLAGRFLPAFFRRRKIMPEGLMALLSLAGIVFAIVTWLRA